MTDCNTVPGTFQRKKGSNKSPTSVADFLDAKPVTLTSSVKKEDEDPMYRKHPMLPPPSRPVQLKRPAEDRCLQQLQTKSIKLIPRWTDVQVAWSCSSVSGYGKKENKKKQHKEEIVKILLGSVHLTNDYRQSPSTQFRVFVVTWILPQLFIVFLLVYDTGLCTKLTIPLLLLHELATAQLTFSLKEDAIFDKVARTKLPPLHHHHHISSSSICGRVVQCWVAAAVQTFIGCMIIKWS